jgi:hypothetical protein
MGYALLHPSYTSLPRYDVYWLLVSEQGAAGASAFAKWMRDRQRR